MWLFHTRFHLDLCEYCQEFASNVSCINLDVFINFRWTLLEHFPQMHPERQRSTLLFSQICFEMFATISRRAACYKKKIIRLSSLCPFFDQLQTKHSIKNLCLLTALCSTMSTNQCQLLLSHHFEEAKSHKPQQSSRRKLFSQSLLKYCAERKSIYEMYIFL